MSKGTKKPDDKEAPDMRAFFTSDTAEQGSEMKITMPGDSTETYSLTVRGDNSKIYRRAYHQALSMGSQLASQEESMKPEEYADKKEANECWLLAHCIKAWPFAQELTIAGAQEFLLNAPQIKDRLNWFTNQAKNFTAVNLTEPPTK